MAQTASAQVVLCASCEAREAAAGCAASWCDRCFHLNPTALTRAPHDAFCQVACTAHAALAAVPAPLAVPQFPPGAVASALLVGGAGAPSAFPAICFGDKYLAGLRGAQRGYVARNPNAPSPLPCLSMAPRTSFSQAKSKTSGGLSATVYQAWSAACTRARVSFACTALAKAKLRRLRSHARRAAGTTLKHSRGLTANSRWFRRKSFRCARRRVPVATSRATGRVRANFAAMKLLSPTGSGVSLTAGRYQTQAFDVRQLAYLSAACFGLASAAAARWSRTRGVQPGLTCIRQWCTRSARAPSTRARARDLAALAWGVRTCAHCAPRASWHRLLQQQVAALRTSRT